MSTYINVVLIKDARTETVEAAAAFTERDQALAFIDECERVETSGHYGYRIDSIRLDPDPLQGY
jgi:hypothetical protein